MVTLSLRIFALCLTVLFVGLLISRQQLVTQARQLEAAWAQKLSGPTEARREALRKSLSQSGATLTPEGSLTRIVFEGSHERCVSLVNRLLVEPYAWESWQGEKVSPSKVKSVILVKAL